MEEKNSGNHIYKGREGNPKKAVALSYDVGDEAPKVIASGKEYLAEKILQVAEEEQIPIHKDEKLADTLSQLEIGEYIPPELYEVVAEILVFVDGMEKIKSKIMKDTSKITKDI